MSHVEITRQNTKYNLRDIKKINYNYTKTYGKRAYHEIDNSEEPPNKRRKTNMIISYNQEDISWDDLNKYESNNLNPDYSKEWVSATSIKNYLLKDPILDWLDYYNISDDLNPKNKSTHNYSTNYSPKNNPDNSLQLLFKMGLKFESTVLEYIKTKFESKKIVNNISDLKPELNNLTHQYMLQGVPIIEQAALYNFTNYTFGIADILIRSDYINKLFQYPILTHEEEIIKSPNLDHNFHYRVIDIKWTKMKLCTNSRTIRNDQRFPAYKGQLAIYNAALGQIQGYTPNEAYVLSKSWKIDNKNKLEGFNCFTLLGVIDYSDFDKKYISETKKAIDWIRNMRNNGHTWQVIPPTISELYPNMHNSYDSPYHNIKKKIADQIKELTQIWMVGYKNRNYAHSNGIFRWDDPDCNSKNLGINGQKIGPVINKIIEINRDDSPKKIYPDIIKNNNFCWNKKTEFDFYIDFETCSGCFYNDIDQNYLQNSEQDHMVLYLIGIGYEENNQFQYKYFVADKLNLFEESRIIKDFIEFIKSKTNKPRLFHWSHAEKSILGLLNTRHKNSWGSWIKDITWIDLCKLFIDEPIVLKGAKNFNLKEIGKNLYNLGLIKTCWFDGPSNGLDAMMFAIDYYKNKAPNNMNHILRYNEIDCKIIWDITNYLRNNHTKN